MTDRTHPEALRLAHIFDHPIPPDWPDMVAAATELRRQNARIAELEAQLEAIGAGGVSGPLMGRTGSKEREALRSIGEEQAFEAWFKVDCPVEGANAKIAAKAAWKARASLAASAGSEPVATVFTMEALAPGGGVKYHATFHKPLPAGTKLYTHPYPPEGMVAAQALRKVLSVVRRYLPPDGPSIQDAMSEIIAIVDPWPLGPLESHEHKNHPGSDHQNLRRLRRHD